MSAIPRITGRFRNRVYRDVIGAVSFGTILAFAFWHGVSRPAFNEFRVFNEKNKAITLAEEKKWMQENNYSRQ